MLNEKTDAILNLFKEDDEAFMEKYLMSLTDEELTNFLDTNPEFLEGLVRE